MMNANSRKRQEQASPKSASLSSHPTLLNALDWANGSYRNAESLIQSRLNNYLFAASILFLAWAAIYVSPESGTRVAVLITLSLLGVVFSTFWWLLALRQRLFFTVTMDFILYLESLLDVEEFRIATTISQLQKGHSVKLLTEDKTVKLGFLEMRLTSRSLVVLSPAVFGIAFLILVIISIIEVCQ
jgi:hypothetical protein